MEQRDTGWSVTEFRGVKLGDTRLERRLQRVAEQLSAKLRTPIYGAAGDWAAAKAAYRFFDNEKVQAEKILAPHREQTLKRMGAEEVTLVIQDSTYLNFSAGTKRDDLGPIGDSRSKAQGLILHHSLAVSVEGLPLGIVTQKIWARGQYHPQTEDQRWAKPIEEKESIRWLEALRETHQLVSSPTSVITVCDREADMYEFFQEATGLGAPMVGRVALNRRLRDAEEKYLFDRMQKLPKVGQIQLSVPQHEQRDRTVVCAVRLGSVTLAPPDRKGRSSLTPLTFYGIVVTEEQAPSDPYEPIEWKLLTNIPTRSFAEALAIIGYYRLRWQIEVLHRILKTGCHVEGCLLATKDRIVRYLVLCSIIAWRIFWLTHIARVAPDTPALSVIAKHELYVLRAVTKPASACKPHLSTAKEVVLAIAMLGGFLNRKHDGPPGPTPIWRGWQLLQQLSLRFNNAATLRGFTTYG
jgi:transposase-like protein/transposase Tn5 family protein